MQCNVKGLPLRAGLRRAPRYIYWQPVNAIGFAITVQPATGDSAPPPVSTEFDIALVVQFFTAET